MILSIRCIRKPWTLSARTNFTLKICSPDVNGRMVALHKGSHHGIDNGKIARKPRNKNVNVNQERKLIHNRNVYHDFWMCSVFSVQCWICQHSQSINVLADAVHSDNLNFSDKCENHCAYLGLLWTTHSKARFVLVNWVWVWKFFVNDGYCVLEQGSKIAVEKRQGQRQKKRTKWSRQFRVTRYTCQCILKCKFQCFFFFFIVIHNFPTKRTTSMWLYVICIPPQYCVNGCCKIIDSFEWKWQRKRNWITDVNTMLFAAI